MAILKSRNCHPPPPDHHSGRASPDREHSQTQAPPSTGAAQQHHIPREEEYKYKIFVGFDDKRRAKDEKITYKNLKDYFNYYGEVLFVVDQGYQAFVMFSTIAARDKALHKRQHSLSHGGHRVTFWVDKGRPRKAQNEGGLS